MGQEKKYAIFTNLGKVGSLWFDIATKIKFRYYVVIRVHKDQKKDP